MIKFCDSLSITQNQTFESMVAKVLFLLYFLLSLI